jgi:DNA modification methylase
LYGDCRETLKELPEQSINTCITSPPYWGLRDYGTGGQLGLEDTPEDFVENLVKVFREVKRVLRDDGTVWLNLGDSYYNYRPGKGQALIKQTVSNTNQDLPQEVARRANKIDGLKEKDLVGIPWRVAFALQADGWYLRQDIIWHKPNPMPESVQDRCTKSHEYIFLLSKNPKYYFDNEAIKEDAEPEKRNKRSVWTITTKPFKGAHFAVFPPDLIEPCILAGCPKDGVVLDPFMGSGTTGMVAQQLGRKWIGCELNAEYISMQKNRTAQQVLEL